MGGKFFPAFITLITLFFKYMIGSGFSVEIYEWVSFQNIEYLDNLSRTYFSA
jgi:hypothetical protein